MFDLPRAQLIVLGVLAIMLFAVSGPLREPEPVSYTHLTLPTSDLV